MFLTLVDLEEKGEMCLAYTLEQTKKSKLELQRYSIYLIRPELCLCHTTASVELCAASVSQFPHLYHVWDRLLSRRYRARCTGEVFSLLLSHSDANSQFLKLSVHLLICRRRICIWICRTGCLVLSCDGAGMQQHDFSRFFSTRARPVCIGVFSEMCSLTLYFNCISTALQPEQIHLAANTPPSPALSHRSTFSHQQSNYLL